METFLQYTIFGLVTGGVYGIAASGLVVTYTTSGIFNFAHGAVAMLAAFVYWQVRFDWGWPAPLALLLVLGVLAPLLGALLYGVVMRGLRGTAEVTRIVVPVSVMLGFLALSTWVWDPTPRQPRLFLMFFGADNTVSIAGVNVTYHELLSVVLAGVVAPGLAVPFLPHAQRRGHAGRGRRPGPARAQRRAARAAGHAVMGAGGVPGGAGRRAHHPHPGHRHARHGPHPAGDRRLRGRHVRPVAQPAPDVPRRAGARPRRQLRHRLLPGRRLDLDRQLPRVAAHDRPVRGAAVPAAGPTAGRHHPAYPGAVPPAQRPQRRGGGAGAGRRDVPGARDPGPHRPQLHGVLDDGGGHRAVVGAAHRLCRRDQPGGAVVRGDRGDRRPPLRHIGQRQRRPLDARRLRA